MSALGDYLKAHLLSCPYKKYFHVECPGCGFQRSLVELVEGNVLLSLKLYPALIPLLCVWLLTVLHLIFKFKNGAFIIKYLFLFCAIIITINYVVRLIKHDVIT